MRHRSIFAVERWSSTAATGSGEVSGERHGGGGMDSK
jgi:hypothetical protein